MTGRIIPLPGDPHERIIGLLPWFVTGRLDATERAEVEAHLGVCPDCRAEERLERRLEAEVAALPLDVEQAWARIGARLGTERPAARGPKVGARMAATSPRQGRGTRPGRAWLIGSVVAQAAIMLLMLGVIWPTARPRSEAPAQYHALGAAPAAAGNLVVMFRPDTAERDMRGALAAAGARLADGPTAAGAYVLRVPPDQRAASLEILRRRAEVTLAQPIDPGGPP
jgi:hypothetical protein